MEASAKNRFNVDEAFLELVHIIRYSPYLYEFVLVHFPAGTSTDSRANCTLTFLDSTRCNFITFLLFWLLFTLGSVNSDGPPFGL